MSGVFLLLFGIEIYFKHTPSTVFMLYSNRALDFHVEGQKVTVSFCFRERLSQTMKNFSIQFGGLERGTHVTEHRLPLCLISHFLYRSEKVLTLKDVPSTLRSLVEVIAQHTNQNAKFKKKNHKPTKTLNSYCLLPLTKP